MKEEEEELERNEREGCLDSQLDWNLTRMLTIVKKESFYMASFRNRPLVLIDGYDGTVHRGPFWINYDRPIVMKGSDQSIEKTF